MKSPKVSEGGERKGMKERNMRRTGKKGRGLSEGDGKEEEVKKNQAKKEKR